MVNTTVAFPVPGEALAGLAGKTGPMDSLQKARGTGSPAFPVFCIPLLWNILAGMLCFGFPVWMDWGVSPGSIVRTNGWEVVRRLLCFPFPIQAWALGGTTPAPDRGVLKTPGMKERNPSLDQPQNEMGRLL